MRFIRSITHKEYYRRCWSHDTHVDGNHWGSCKKKNIITINSPEPKYCHFRHTQLEDKHIRHDCDIDKTINIIWKYVYIYMLHLNMKH